MLLVVREVGIKATTISYYTLTKVKNLGVTIENDDDVEQYCGYRCKLL
jgi:hypothetical protein